MRNSTLKDYITGIVEEPVLIHTAQMMDGRGIEAVGWLIVRMRVLRQLVIFRYFFVICQLIFQFGTLVLQLFVIIDNLVAH